MSQYSDRAAKALRTAAAAFLALLFFAAPGQTADTKHREAGAHVHGHGQVNIAIENGQVLIELEAPGADIVGFEHKPSNADQQAVLDSALKKLRAAAAIVKLTEAAQCSVVQASAELEAHEADHAEIHASYIFQCRRITALTSIDFAFFKAFPNSAQLQGALIGPRAQKQFTVTPASPSISVKGLL